VRSAWSVINSPVREAGWALFAARRRRTTRGPGTADRSGSTMPRRWHGLRPPY